MAEHRYRPAAAEASGEAGESDYVCEGPAGA